MTGLFPQLEQEEKQSRGPVAAVALEQGIDHLLDYTIPAKLAGILQPGQRVKVPLGRKNRPAYGVVVRILNESDYPQLKTLFGIDDERVLIDKNLMELALWMSKYYITPLGLVLENMIPSAVRQRTGLGRRKIVRALKNREELQAIFEGTKAPKRRAILARLLLLEPDATIDLIKLAGESGTTKATIQKLAAPGILKIGSQDDLPRFAESIGQATTTLETDIQLNPEQQKVFDDLSPRLTNGQFSVNLLLGVTGSGKTEVYLQCIRKIVEQKKQAVVLVPEIALTPQTVRRFTARFPRVAVLHSGLTQTERHRFWYQISTGHADVIVGARSAIFAPVPNLGMVVVDEEHESSYKQDTAPRYHARDLAIKRGQLENVPVLLGSATPSLEMFHKASEAASDPLSPRPAKSSVESERVRARADESGGVSSSNNIESSVAPHPSPLPEGEGARASIYHLLRLPSRVRGLAMPHVELLDMKQESKLRRGVHLISTRLETLLTAALAKGEQAILLLNRRGYSNFVYCASCQEAIQCKYCDTTMTYHRSAGVAAANAKLEEGLHKGQLHCHYCLAVNQLPDKCPNCSKKLILFGLGTQRVEEELLHKFPTLKYERVDSDTMRSGRDYETTLSKFAKKEIQLLLGTQMIAKGLDFPNVTLVGVISGDTALSLPDFRASERTFQLITQVAGRAGRGDLPGRVVLQTFQPTDPTIQSALKQDYIGFAKRELGTRKEVGLPPFARLVRIVIRNQDQPKLHKQSEDIGAQLALAAQKYGNQLWYRGPMPCPISRISGFYRNQIVIYGRSAGALQNLLAELRDEGHLATNDRVAVDVDPVSLL